MQEVAGGFAAYLQTKSGYAHSYRVAVAINLKEVMGEVAFSACEDELVCVLIASSGDEESLFMGYAKKLGYSLLDTAKFFP